MAEAGGVAAAAGPAAVAVHDDPDVPGNLGVQSQHSVPVVLEVVAGGSGAQTNAPGGATQCASRTRIRQ